MIVILMSVNGSSFSQLLVAFIFFFLFQSRAFASRLTLARAVNASKWTSHADGAHRRRSAAWLKETGQGPNMSISKGKTLLASPESLESHSTPCPKVNFCAWIFQITTCLNCLCVVSLVPLLWWVHSSLWWRGVSEGQVVERGQNRESSR